MNGGPGASGKLSLVAYPDEVVVFRKRKAMPLRLVNRTEKVVEFAACDSSLYIVEERLDPNGQWRALETFPSAICGNSYHRVFLEPEEYWEFHVLPWHGGFRTRLRFRLEPGGEFGICRGGQAIYSNEFEGPSDPGAFTEEPGPARIHRTRTDIWPEPR